MKKMIALLLAAMMLLSLAACGGNNEPKISQEQAAVNAHMEALQNLKKDLDAAVSAKEFDKLESLSASFETLTGKNETLKTALAGVDAEAAATFETSAKELTDSLTAAFEAADLAKLNNDVDVYIEDLKACITELEEALEALDADWLTAWLEDFTAFDSRGEELSEALKEVDEDAAADFEEEATELMEEAAEILLDAQKNVLQKSADEFLAQMQTLVDEIIAAFQEGDTETMTALAEDLDEMSTQVENIEIALAEVDPDAADEFYIAVEDMMYDLTAALKGVEYADAEFYLSNITYLTYAMIAAGEAGDYETLSALAVELESIGTVGDQIYYALAEVDQTAADEFQQTILDLMAELTAYLETLN